MRVGAAGCEARARAAGGAGTRRRLSARPAGSGRLPETQNGGGGGGVSRTLRNLLGRMNTSHSTNVMTVETRRNQEDQKNVTSFQKKTFWTAKSVLLQRDAKVERPRLKTLRKSITKARGNMLLVKRRRVKKQVLPARGGVLRAWKLLSKSVTSRSTGREAGADLSLVKETALRMAEEQSNIQSPDLAAEEDQNKVAIDIPDPKGKEVGAEKDTIEMKHGDGKDVAIPMITIHLMRQETVERESSLTAMQPLTNGLQLTTAGHISIIITKVDGLTVPS
ncbi:uncharacterized protein [Anas platyrhynchos]|uniref:uncharacterized protein isoform X2 n=1 Tax=Anas platyrhynchos TaxID=8839 RepID=UPI003AF26493